MGIKNCCRISTEKGKIEKKPRKQNAFTTEYLFLYKYLIPKRATNHVDGMYVGPAMPCFITFIWHLSVELYVCDY